MSFSCLLLFIVFLQFAQSPVTHLLIPLLRVFQLRPDNYIVAYVTFINKSGEKNSIL